MPCVSVVFGSSTHPWLECPSTTKKMDGPWTEEMILAAVAAKGKAAAWSDHNGALKYFRDNQPLTADRILSTSEWVKDVVHGLKQNYTFGEWKEWDWRTMVAAFNDVDRRRVIGAGITAVAVSKRVGSYDHHMAVAAKECMWENACTEIVDFSITRTDGSVVLVHPRWKKKGTKLSVIELPPGGMPIAIMPEHGPGRSDGPGTYRRVTGAAYTVSAFTPAVAGPGTPVVVGPGTPMVAGPGMPAVAAAVIATTAAITFATTASGSQTPLFAGGNPTRPQPPPPPGPYPSGPAVAGHQPPPPACTGPVAAVAATVLENMD